MEGEVRAAEAALTERDQAYIQIEVEKKKGADLEHELSTVKAAMESLEAEKAALASEKAELEKAKIEAEQRHRRESKRLRESRSYEVTQERLRVQAAMLAKANC